MPPESGTSPWDRVRALRLALADRMEGLGADQWDRPSWCAGWRVRDVLGHLVHLAEASRGSMAGDIVRHGLRPDAALSKMARRHGDEPVPILVDRLRRAVDGRFHVPGSPPVVVLGEVVVHGEDISGSLGLSSDARASDAALVLDTYRRIGRLAFHGRSLGAVRLSATHVGWSVGRGPLVEGRAVDLLLLLADRRQVLPRLAGEGAALLSESSG